MNLDIAWSAPSPIPGCGYKALYRRKADPSYTEVDTSGTTLTIGVEAPASYEGKLVSDCCSDSLSSGTPFGVNGYSVLNGSAIFDANTLILTLSSTYSNPYDHLVSGIVTVVLNNASHQDIPFSVTYAAGNTTQNFNLGIVQGVSVFSTTINSIAPVFNNGGQLQQLDAVNTPPYFKFYWSGDISGTTWDGAPADLPSFTLDAFTVTEISPDNTTILAGILNMSYILDTLYASVYTSMNIEIFDPLDAAPIGTIIVNTSPLGLRSTSVSLTKGSSPLTTATGFIMRTLLPDLTVLDTKTFYLPS
jgi:hypothetical protein